MIYLASIILSMFLTIVLIPIFKKLAIRLNIMDIPNKRKLHLNPIPKTGGLAMAFGIFAPVILWGPESELLTAILMGASVVFLFGTIDDLKGINYQVKLSGQLIAALIVVFYGGIKIKIIGTFCGYDLILSDWYSIPLTIFVIVGVINAFNLSDGLDGLAGGISLLSFICIGYLAYQADQIIICFLAVAITGSIIGFLRYNTHPAILFMGDAGSQIIGFFAITLVLSLTQAHNPLCRLLPLILMGYPVLDTLTVFVKRISKGNSPFIADKGHFHHKFIYLGLSHNEAVLLIYILQAGLISLGYVFRFYSEVFILMLYLAFAGVILKSMSVAAKKGWKINRLRHLPKYFKRPIMGIFSEEILIKVLFKSIETGIPLMFFFTCFVPNKIPRTISICSIVLFALILGMWFTKKQWVSGILRLSLYIIIPFLLFIGETNAQLWMMPAIEYIYNLSFVALAIGVYLTLRFTRRKDGFRSTPLDFLILFIAFVPGLIDPQIRSYHMGFLAAKIIVLLFSYEVLMGELRGKITKLGVSTAILMLVVGIRGII